MHDVLFFLKDRHYPQFPFIVLCKLLAKEQERVLVAERFDIPELLYFASNVTLSRSDAVTILVEGTIEAHIRVRNNNIPF